MLHNLIPMVIDNNEQWGRSYDIYSMLLKNRIVYLGMPINQEVANVIVAQILYLNSQGNQQPIHLYINSPGGEVYSGLAIYDAMQMVGAPVYTYAVGVTASMGTALLAAGAAGHRYALPHATIHMHPTGSGMKGYTEDVRIAFRERAPMEGFLVWLRDRHLADVCAAGALDAELVRLDGEGFVLEARYRFASREEFGRYERDEAPRLRAEGLAEIARLGLSADQVSFARATGEIVPRKVTG